MSFGKMLFTSPVFENSVKYSYLNVQLRIEIGMDELHDKGAPVFHERIFGLFNKLDM